MGPAGTDFTAFIQRLEESKTFLARCYLSYIIESSRNLSTNHINKVISMLHRGQRATKWNSKIVGPSDFAKFMDARHKSKGHEIAGDDENETDDEGYDGDSTQAKEDEEEIELLRNLAAQDDPAKEEANRKAEKYFQETGASLKKLFQEVDAIKGKPAENQTSGSTNPKPAPILQYTQRSDLV